VKIFKGTFVKKDGTQRDMEFVKLSDIPENVQQSLFTTGKPAAQLPDTMYRVWDLGADGVRTFNTATQVGDLRESEQEVVIGGFHL